MNFRRWVCLFTLFVLIGELLEPSTNFVRTQPEQTAQHFVFGDEHPQDHHNEHHRKLDSSAGVHCAYVARSFVFDAPVGLHTGFQEYKESLNEEPLSSIFQPPKLA